MTESLLSDTRVLRFGSVSLTAEPGRSAAPAAESVRLLPVTLGAALPQLARQESFEAHTREEPERILRFADRAALITAGRHGVIPAVPTPEEME